MPKVLISEDISQNHPVWMVFSNRVNPGPLDGPVSFNSDVAARDWINKRFEGYMNGSEAANFPTYFLSKLQDMEMFSVIEGVTQDA